MPQTGLPLIDFLVILFYLALMLGIGWFFSRFMKGGKEFFIGGNLIPWWVAGISLYMTTFSAWMFTGAASFVYNTGWFGIIFLAVKPIAFYIGFKLSAVRWRRARITTPVEYVRTRFNKTTHLVLSIMLILSMIYWPGHHLASLSKICAPTLFPGSPWAIDIMIVTAGIFILIYTISGGFWAVCITDVVQFLILFSICVILIPACFLSGELGSLGDFAAKIPPLEFSHLIRGTTLYDHWYLIGWVVAGIFGFSVGDKAQRFFSVRDEAAAKKTAWMTVGLFITAPILFGVPPLVGKVLWPDIADLTYFSSVTKPDENIFIAVVMRYLPAGLVGIFLSAMMAASMSALDSVWNTVSSVVSVDIYKNIFRPRATEKEVLRVGRITILVLCVIAIIMGLAITHSDQGVFTISNIVSALVAIPITIPLLCGILSRNISRWCAISAILAGTLTSASMRFVLGYSIGPQSIATVLVSLFFIYSSLPLGRLYARSKFQALAASACVGLLIWAYALLFNHNTNLSFATLSDPAHIPVIIISLAYAALLYGFTTLYAKDLQSPHTEVDDFFQRLETPIDIEKELPEESGQTRNSYFIVGGISMAFALISLLILIVPAARTKIWVNIAMSALLFLIGFLIYWSSRKAPRKVNSTVTDHGTA